MRARLLVMNERVSGLIAGHPLVAFLITAIALATLADSVRQVLAEGGHVTWLTFGFIAMMVYAVVGTLWLSRYFAPNVRLFVSWVMGMSPALLGVVAALANSPVLIMWIGLLLSLCLVGLIAFRVPSAGD